MVCAPQEEAEAEVQRLLAAGVVVGPEHYDLLIRLRAARGDVAGARALLSVRPGVRATLGPALRVSWCGLLWLPGAGGLSRAGAPAASGRAVCTRPCYYGFIVLVSIVSRITVLLLRAVCTRPWCGPERQTDAVAVRPACGPQGCFTDRRFAPVQPSTYAALVAGLASALRMAPARGAFPDAFAPAGAPPLPLSITRDADPVLVAPDFDLAQEQVGPSRRMAAPASAAVVLRAGAACLGEGAWAA